MEPVYMNMQSYPHQDSMLYRPRCYSGMEPRPPMSYGCWPWAGHYGYAAPGACPNHAYMPAHYAWGSPYSHVPSYHCPGNYPYFPAQYMPPPPPCNVMEHPRCEYEKNVPMEHHCCGCPNHPSHHPFYPKEQRNVRIEEEEPEKEKRKNDSLVPLQLKNSPYPIVWLPPDYKEQGKVQDAVGKKDVSRDMKVRDNGEIAEQEPPFMKGCLPVDLNALVSSKQGGDGEKNDHQEGGKRNFPFPLFWIPCKPDDTKRDSRPEVKDVNPRPSLESEKGSDGEKNCHVNSGNVGDLTTPRAKSIPVKEVEQNVVKDISMVKEKERDTSVRERADKSQKKSDTEDEVSPADGSQRKSPSPSKSSKLPPVCLRVDPLPRKRSANGKSRYPSPPGDKRKLELQSNEVSKAHSSDNGDKTKQGKDAITIAVVDGNASLEKSTNVNVIADEKLPAKSQDDVSLNQAEVKPEEEHVAQKKTKDDAVVKEQSEDNVSAGGEKKETFKADGMKVDAAKQCRDLSEEEAAVIIQSAFRRFDVCRWKPLEKLKQIARVREQIAHVKQLIHDLELSFDMQGRAKQKNIIAETIMSLLLKLDTIQGLHPSVREIRKSVVRELVSLQEHLDSIMIEKSDDSATQETLAKGDDESASKKSKDVMMPENGDETNSVDLQNHIEEEFKSEEANLTEEAAIVKTGIEELSESSVDEGVKAAQGPATEGEDGKSSEMLKNNEASVAKEDIEAIIPGEASYLLSLHEQASARATHSAPDEGIKEAQGPAAEDENDKSCEVAQNKDASVGKEDNEAIIPEQGSDPSALQEAASIRLADSSPDNHDAAVPSVLAELPQGVVDDDLCGANHSAMEAYTSQTDQSKQLEEKLIESPTVEKSHHETAADPEYYHVTMKAHDASDFPLNGAEPGTEENDTDGSLDNYKLGDKLKEEEDSKSGVARSEPNECTPQQPANLTADLIEPSVGYDERELPTAGSCTIYDKPRESSGSMEEGKLEPSLQEEGDLEKTSLINEYASTYDAVNMDEVERAADAESNDGDDACMDERSAAVDLIHSGGRISEVSKQGEECNAEHPRPEEATGEKSERMVAHAVGGDDIKESNRKLMEENERLREMMEKLIKSGQEQLTAISSLSGRVKDMEKRLSRKKKLKVKQFKAPRSSKFNEVNQTIGVNV